MDWQKRFIIPILENNNYKLVIHLFMVLKKPIALLLKNIAGNGLGLCDARPN